jgi:hypothetical protein
MAVQVDYRISPSDQFSVYNPDTKSNKTITYFTLLAKIRGDLNLSAASGGGDISGSGEYNYVAKFDGEKSITKSQIYDSGIYVGIGDITPSHKLGIAGGAFADYFQLDTTYSNGSIAGRFSWNPDRETAELGLDGTVSLILGQDNLWYVKNQTGTAIPKGRAVMAVGALGASGRILVAPMVADGSVSPKYLIGVTIEEIANGDDGFVISQGKLRGFNTSGYTQGSVLYCDPSNAGQFTDTEPTAPDLKLPIAFTVDSKSNGTLAIRVTAGTTISEANDVQITSVSNDQFLRYNSTSGAWENETVTFGTVTSVDLTAGTGISVSGGPITTSGSITVTNTAPDQTVVLNSGTGINVTGTYPTFTIAATGGTGTVTSIATTAPIQGGTITTTGTISITQSGASSDGYLSSADWNTFNNKESAITKGDLTEATSSILTITGGTNAIIGTGTTIEVTQATTSTSGYLSSTDWNTFNNKASDAFKTIAVSGQSDVVADSATDTLTLVAGSNITITTDDTTDSITITSSGSTAGSGTTNQIAKWASSTTLGDSSISDLGTAGTTISINSSGTATFDNEIITEDSVQIFSDAFETQIIMADSTATSAYWRMGIDSASANYVAFSTGGSAPYDNHMVISRADGGRVGIKTAAPTKTLHVAGTALIESATTVEGSFEMGADFRPSVTTYTASSGSTTNVSSSDYIVFMDWTGGAGTGNAYLPTLYGYGSYNPVFRFLASGNVSASNIVRVYPNTSDIGTNINGNAYVELAAARAVVTVVAIAGQWYILDSR